MTGKRLDLSRRLARNQGRVSRLKVLGIRLSADEVEKVQKAAEAAEAFTGEWAREVLLREATGQHTDRAMFTELVALRQLLTSTIRFLVTGKPMTESQYDKLTADLRSSKHETAREVLDQYSIQRGL